MSFSTQEKIWLVQHYSPSEGYTKLRRDFIRHFEITNKHNVPRLTAFKRVLMIFELKMVVETFTREVSSDTLLRVSDNFMKRAAFCVQEKGGHFEHILKLTK